MRLSSIQSAYSARELQLPVKAVRASEKEAPAAKTTKKDKVELSSEGMSRLEKIQQKVKSGYYNNEAVNEDISDKLSKLFNEMEF